MKDTIRIGTMAGKGQDTPNYLKQILPHGFESFELALNKDALKVDMKRLAAETLAVLGDDAVVSCLGIYGNPLEGDAGADADRKCWETLIDSCALFKCDLVCGFTGRLRGKPIDECIPRFSEVFTPLAKRAADKGVRIAFENCEMGGNWKTGDYNIAHTPDAWELMFNAVPLDNIGLEWEPCHQMVKLIDPMPQLRKWVGRIFHLHGKDATILWDVVKQHGINGPHRFAFHRTPGFGDSNWTDIISELRRGGFKGSIDIEGWHDPVYRDTLEMTGQVHGLKHLKYCRGGDLVPNPA